MQSILAAELNEGIASFAASPIMLLVFLLLVVVGLLISPYQGAAMEPAR